MRLRLHDQTGCCCAAVQEHPVVVSGSRELVRLAGAEVRVFGQFQAGSLAGVWRSTWRCFLGCLLMLQAQRPLRTFVGNEPGADLCDVVRCVTSCAVRGFCSPLPAAAPGQRVGEFPYAPVHLCESCPEHCLFRAAVQAHVIQRTRAGHCSVLPGPGRRSGLEMPDAVLPS